MTGPPEAYRTSRRSRDPATAPAPLPGPWAPPIVMALILATPAGMARAQDLDEPEAPAVIRNAFELSETNFNQWIFGNGPRNASARQNLDSHLMLSVADVERSCSLSAAQKRKLMLAGQGDIKRFMDRVAEARSVFDRLRRDQGRMNEIVRETQPLAAALKAGLFGDGSFFAKTLGTTLDPEQSDRYRRALLERARFQYRARVSLALANLDAAVGFTSDQYRRFVDLILEETSPSGGSAGPYEAQIILLKIARLPESKVRPIFDEPRWKALGRQLDQARGMERFLQANGHIEPDEPTSRGDKKPD